jgi:hypothetical protein
MQHNAIFSLLVLAISVVVANAAAIEYIAAFAIREGVSETTTLHF